MTYPQEMLSRSTDVARSGRQGELALLARIRARLEKAHHPRLHLGIGDDCALLRLRPNEELAVTTDLSIAHRHFRLDWHPPDSIGHRTLARGLSDLAAMGARPVAAFLSLGLPPELIQNAKRRKPWPDRFLDRFLDGFLSLAAAHQTPLAGGDLAESPVAVADIVLTGAVPRNKALLRSGARPGDLLYVTGCLGGSAAGLARLAQIAATSRKHRRKQQCLRIPSEFKTILAPHLYPQPRIAQGLWLVRHSRATAAIDLSDGLSTDLTHLCQESGVAAEVDAAALPLYPAATLAQALHGGEDYELLFTASASARLPRSVAGVPITRIGRILRRRPTQPLLTLLASRRTQPLTPHGWEHFA